MALSKSGLELVAEGSDEFFKALDKAEKAVNDFGNDVTDAAKKSDKGFSAIDQAAQGIGSAVSGAVNTASTALSSLASKAGEVGDAFAEADKRAGAAFRDLAGGVATAGLAGIATAAGVASTALFQAGENAKIIKAAFGDLPVDQLQMVNDQAELLAARYGVDLAEAVGAATVLQQEFGLSTEQAMNFVTAGFENGLNASDDFLDTIGEYSNLFAESGAGADEFFSLIQTGMAGGVLGTDKAADAFKEFGIRIREMSDDVWGPDGSMRMGLGMTNEEIDKLFNGMRDGTVSVSDVFDDLMPRLAAVENDVHRNTIGVKLFGTQWEDLGASAVLGIDTAKYSMDDLAATSEAAFQRIDSLSEIPGRLFGSLVTAAMPASEALVDVINAAMEFGPASDEAAAALASLGETLGLSKEQAAQLSSAFQGVATYFSGPFQADFARGVDLVTSKLNELGASPFGQELQQGAQVVAAYFSGPFAGDLNRGVEGVIKGLQKIGADDWWELVMLNAGKVAEYFLNDWPAQFQDGANKAYNWLKELPFLIAKLSGDFTRAAADIGSNIIDGITQGLEDAAGGLFSAIRGIIDQALGAAESEGEIQSPSELFAREVGLPIVQGVAIGITRSQALVMQASGGMIDGALGQASEAVDDGDPMAIGGDIVAGISEGVGEASFTLTETMRSTMQSALSAAQDEAAINSPSDVFADDVGQPIVAGVARGIEDNLDLLRQAAAAMGEPFQEEFDALAENVQAIIDGLYADLLQGTADFVRGQVSALSALDSLREGNADDSGVTDAYSAIRDAEKGIKKIDKDRAKLESERQKQVADGRAKETKLIADQAKKREAALKKEDDLAKKLNTLLGDPEASDEKIAAARAAYAEAQSNTAALETEQARTLQEFRDAQSLAALAMDDKFKALEADRIAAYQDAQNAQTQLDAANARKIELDKIANDAEKRTREAIEASKDIADPRERKLYLDTVTGFIEEEAQYRRDILTAESDEERARLEERLALVQEAQRTEAEIYARGAEERQREFEIQLTAAQEAARQLGDFVYYSQEDAYGVGSDVAQGIATGLRDQLQGLGELIGSAMEESIRRAREMLGIASPSKVAADMVGAPLADGIAMGFMESIAASVGAMGNAARAVVTPIASKVAQATTTNQQTSVVNNYQYQPSYNGSPRQPSQDFAAMRALNGAR
jgi:phage-related minor tail protein